jgi:hypothetical protein
MPSRSTAWPIARASIWSDFPGSRSPRRETPIRFGATRTTRSPAARSASVRPSNGRQTDYESVRHQPKTQLGQPDSTPSRTKVFLPASAGLPADRDRNGPGRSHARRSCSYVKSGQHFAKFHVGAGLAFGV